MIRPGHLPPNQQAIVTGLWWGLIWLFLVFRQIRKYIQFKKKERYEDWCKEHIPDIHKHWIE